MAKRIIFLGIVLLAAMAAGGYAIWRLAKTAAPAVPVVKVAPAPPGVAAQSFTATLRAVEVTLVPAPVDGTLENVDVVEGQDVVATMPLGRIRNNTAMVAKQGIEEELERAQAKASAIESQTIAGRLEASRLKADADRAKGEWENVQRVFQREQAMFQQGAMARLTFEKTKAKYEAAAKEHQSLGALLGAAEERVAGLTKQFEEAREVARAKAEELEENKDELASGEVIAPVSGWLVGAKAKSGDEVTMDVKDLFTIATSLEKMEAVVELPEALLKQLKEGVGALVQIAEAGDTPMRGVVVKLEPGRAVVAFQNQSAAVRPGMTARVKFE